MNDEFQGNPIVNDINARAKQSKKTLRKYVKDNLDTIKNLDILKLSESMNLPAILNKLSKTAYFDEILVHWGDDPLHHALLRSLNKGSSWHISNLLNALRLQPLILSRLMEERKALESAILHVLRKGIAHGIAITLNAFKSNPQFLEDSIIEKNKAIFFSALVRCLINSEAIATVIILDTLKNIPSVIEWLIYENFEILYLALINILDKGDARGISTILDVFKTSPLVFDRLTQGNSTLLDKALVKVFKNRNCLSIAYALNSLKNYPNIPANWLTNKKILAPFYTALRDIYKELDISWIVYTEHFLEFHPNILLDWLMDNHPSKKSNSKVFLFALQYLVGQSSQADFDQLLSLLMNFRRLLQEKNDPTVARFYQSKNGSAISLFLDDHMKRMESSNVAPEPEVQFSSNWSEITIESETPEENLDDSYQNGIASIVEAESRDGIKDNSILFLMEQEMDSLPKAFSSHGSISYEDPLLLLPSDLQTSIVLPVQEVRDPKVPLDSRSTIPRVSFHDIDFFKNPCVLPLAPDDFIFVIPTTGSRRYQPTQAIISMLEQAIGSEFKATLILGLNRKNGEENDNELLQINQEIKHHLNTPGGRLNVRVHTFTWEMSSYDINIKTDIPFGQIRNKLTWHLHEYIKSSGNENPIVCLLDADVRLTIHTLHKIMETKLTAGSLGSIYKSADETLESMLMEQTSLFDMAIKNELSDNAYLIEHCLFLKAKALQYILDEVEQVGDTYQFPFDLYAAEGRGLFRFLRVMDLNYGYLDVGKDIPVNVSRPKNFMIENKPLDQLDWSDVKKAFFALPYSSAKKENFAKQLGIVHGLLKEAYIINKLAGVVYLPTMIKHGVPSQEAALTWINNVFNTLADHELDILPPHMRMQLSEFKHCSLSKFGEKQSLVLDICKRWAITSVRYFFNPSQGLDSPKKQAIWNKIQQLLVNRPTKLNFSDNLISSILHKSNSKFYFCDLAYRYAQRKALSSEKNKMSQQEPSSPSLDEVLSDDNFPECTLNIRPFTDFDTFFNDEETIAVPRKAHYRRQGIDKFNRETFVVLYINIIINKNNSKAVFLEIKQKVPANGMVILSSRRFFIWKNGSLDPQNDHLLELDSTQTRILHGFIKNYIHREKEVHVLPLSKEELSLLKQSLQIKFCRLVPVRSTIAHLHPTKGSSHKQHCLFSSKKTSKIDPMLKESESEFEPEVGKKVKR